MCGIAGLMTRDGSPPSKTKLKDMLYSIGHRGTDGEGLHLAKGVGLGHNRLAIIDLDTGEQPLHDLQGNVLVANAEIYNYLELKNNLSNVQFATASDCEAPLHLYQRYGKDFVKYLRGMYAIAIYDSTNDSLLLTRDPFGIKPLYYCETISQFAFASEPRALLDAGITNRQIVSPQRNQLLQLQFTCGRQTIFKDIQRVLPGETLVIRQGRIVARYYTDVFLNDKKVLPAPTSVENALELLDQVLCESVKIHQRSDVPYGLFLSGGIDSTAILALMARLNDRPVRTYTVGFSGTSVHDERTHAKSIAANVGAEYEEIEFSESDFWSLLPKVAASVDDPTSDYAILPSWKLARKAACDLKVVLCGEGGDELFAGYGRYRRILRPWWLGGRNLRTRGILDGLDVLRTEPHAWRYAFGVAQSNAKIPDRTPLQIAQATDCTDWLPNDLLTKLDRCLMSHGLEGRTPFLDRDVSNFAFHLPDNMKIQRGFGKWILRQWLQRVMPEARPFERKRGFTVPVGEWMRRDGQKLGQLVAYHPAIISICKPDRVKKLFVSADKRAGIASWTLLFYSLWHHSFVENQPTDGNIFDTLANAAK